MCCWCAVPGVLVLPLHGQPGNHRRRQARRRPEELRQRRSEVARAHPVHRILGRGESRNSLARDIFHGGRGHLRQHYHAGQENQLGALGLMVNVIVLWQTVYIQAALDHLVANGYEPDPADVARLSPLDHPTINLQGRYRTTNRAPSSGLRPLRTTR